jgi:putative DNA methylase
MPKRKKLIEVALPLEAINEASAREKSIRHGHPSTLHLWWARRPLAACRAVIFASLVDDPNDPDAPPAYVEACCKLPLGKNAAEHDTPRQRLFDFIERLVLWESTTDEQVLETARELIRLATEGNPPPLLDPFAGGGSIPLEAQRLGLEAHASDLNPVAVMINKAQIEIPPRFAGQAPVNPKDREKVGGGASWKGAAGLAADVQYYGEWIRDHAYTLIGHLYPSYKDETTLAWLWTRTVKCPNPACGTQMPLARSFDLYRKKGQRAWVEPHVDAETRKVTFDVKQNQKKGKGPKGVVNRRGARCIACGTPVPFDHIRSEGRAGRMHARLMAIMTEGENGRSFHGPDVRHVAVAEAANPNWIPDYPLPVNPRDFKTPNYGMTSFAELFTNRQIVALNTFSSVVREVREQIRQDGLQVGLRDDDVPLRKGGTGARAYAEAVSIYLAFGVDKATDYWSTIATWMTRGTVGHMFARQAIPMTWDYPEVNPFTDFHCGWTQLLTWIVKSIQTLSPLQAGVAIQQDATSISSNDAVPISTDPPYYDNISYAQLSDYFYIWMRSNLEGVYPDLFGTMLVPKSAEMVASPYRFDGDTDLADEHFESGLLKAFSAMREVIPPSYPLTVYYAFKQEELVADEGVASTGWETMLKGLIESGFAIVGTWPMRTERSARSIGQGANALASSIVLVCRSRPEDAPMTSRRDFVNTLRQELPAALREMQSGNIAPVDLAQASIGPGMAVYSRYAKVLEPNGDRLTVRAALQLINQALDEYLAEQEGDLDQESRFAVAWFEQYGFETGDFGVADVLARAKNTSVEALAHEGILKSGAGKVRLLKWSELDEAWEPTAEAHLPVWKVTHHLIQRLNNEGEAGAATLLAQLSPDLAAQARQLAYRLYSVSERKGWADHARDYNALVVSWGASQEQAVEMRQQRYEQGNLFG